LSADQTAEKLNTDLVEFSTHSFVVKIWIEETPDESRNPLWRGHITHVPSGERRYLKSLNGLRAFVGPYLKLMGVKVGLYWRLRNRLSGWFRSQSGQKMLRPTIDKK
jgi:hypothetical protein